MTPSEFKWNVYANIASAIIIFVLGSAFYLLHQRYERNRRQ